MVNFAKAAALAKRLIEANGRNVTVVKMSQTAANSAQPWRASEATPEASYGVIAAIVPATGSGLGRQRVVDGTLEDSYDQVALVAASSLPAGVSLEGFTFLDDGSTRWKIGTVETLNPAATTVLYSIGLRR